MGQFAVKVALAHPSDPSRLAEVELVVDTGTTLSWVPREVIERLGAPIIQRRTFHLLDSRMVERDTAAVVLRLKTAKSTILL